MTNNKPEQEEKPVNKHELVSRTKLLEAGVYFGHKKTLWNPKMKPYLHNLKTISTTSGKQSRDIHFIDINKTMKALDFAYSLIEKLVSKNATFMFVGTSNRAKETIRKNALRTNSLYVSEKWLGGTLTNWGTISKGVKKMLELQRQAENNFEGYTKKEGLLLAKELKKKERNFSGIKNMQSKPNVMFVADLDHDAIAIKEARAIQKSFPKEPIIVIGIVDSNNDPTLVDVAIPANNDSVKSIELITTLLADAIVKAKDGEQLFAFQPDEKIVLTEDKRNLNRNANRDFKNRRPNLKPTFSRIRDNKEQEITKKDQESKTSETSEKSSLEQKTALEEKTNFKNNVEQKVNAKTSNHKETESESDGTKDE